MKKVVALLFIPIAAAGLIWGAVSYFAGQLLYPSWRINDLSYCEKEDYRSKKWGPSCGNARLLKQYKAVDLKVKGPDGLEAKGWYIPRSGNADVRAAGAVMFTHGGGSDRREGSRFIDFAHKRGLDFYAFDLRCHGESACKFKELSFGEREHTEVIAVYEFLRKRHSGKIVAIGTSLGAVSTLTALPKLRGIHAIVAENPFYSLSRFIAETPAAPFPLPGWFVGMVQDSVLSRGKFSGKINAATGIKGGKSVPILFMHSKNDKLIPYTHTVSLHKEYAGPKVLLITEKSSHSNMWNEDAALTRKAMADFFDKYVN